MELTFKNLAQKYGTTKANMRARIKKLERDNPEIQVTKIKNNTTVLTDTGFRLLEEEATRRPFTKKRQKTAPEPTKTADKGYKDYSKGYQLNYLKDMGVITHSEKLVDNALLDILKSQIETNSKQIESLHSQLEAKDKQIADLIETVNQSLKQLNELTDKLTNLTGHAQAIIDRDRQPLTAPETETAPQAKDEVIEEVTEIQPSRPKKLSFISKMVIASRIFREF